MTPMMPIDELITHAKLDHGIVTLQPLNFVIGFGRIQSDISPTGRVAR